MLKWTLRIGGGLVALAGFVLALVGPPAFAQAQATDSSPHTVSFVTTSDGVKLEVLDWGGSGAPLVMIAGLGADAHVFDRFVARFAGKYHVYGVTRRGYGASDRPDPAGGSYTADRLGDDVLAVIDKLKLEKPVLAGWSIGGQELSSIGSRYPEKVSGLIYLDAGYSYSFYSSGNLIPPNLNLIIDANDIKARVSRLNAPGVNGDQVLVMFDELLNSAVPQLQADLMASQKITREALASIPAPPPSSPPPETPASRISAAIWAGAQKYTRIEAPILAIFAPVSPPPSTASEGSRANYALRHAAEIEQVKRFQAGLPHARVVSIPNAQHAIFVSHPEEVAREMTAFIDGLN